jgi:hypothetical protein
MAIMAVDASDSDLAAVLIHTINLLFTYGNLYYTVHCSMALWMIATWSAGTAFFFSI